MLARVFGGLLVASLAGAQPAGSPPARVEHFRLGNGLEVVLQPDPHTASIAVMMAYETGSRDDPEGYEHLAHVVEHMTYGGSRHLRANQALEQLELAGMQEHNGVTTSDATLYYTLIPARALPLVLWIESERMAFTLENFSHRLLAHERDVVRNELLTRLGPSTVFRSYFERALYGEGHPYAKLAYPFSDVAAIELDDARWFFQQGYRPSNARLVIVGDMNASRVRAEVEKYFAPVVEPRLPLARRSSRRPPVASAAHLRFEHPTFREEFLMGWPVPAPAAPERAAAEVLIHLLQTRLQNHLVHELRDLAGLDLDIVDRELGSLLVLEGYLTENTQAADVEGAVLRAIRTLPRAELERYRREAIATAVLRELGNLENPLVIAGRHVSALRHSGQPYRLADRLAALRAVGLDDLERAQRRLAAAKTVVASLVRPPEGTPPIPGGELIETP